MKIKLKNILILMLLSFFLCNLEVNAASEITSRETIKIDNNIVYQLFDDKILNETNRHGVEASITTLTIDGTPHYGFCIDFGVEIYEGKTINNILNLYKYFNNALSEEVSRKLVNDITLYMKYGYGSDGKKTDRYYLATQQLIWEAIKETGFYKTDFYEGRKGRKVDFENFGWTTDGNNKIDLSTELNSIKNDINKYYITPSFCSIKETLEIEIGETEEFIDENKVLEYYQIKCENGLMCTKDGNKLKVSAINESGSREINFHKPQSGTETLVYRADEDQGIIINQGLLEPVNCKFGIDTFKNEKTSDIQIIYIAVIGIFAAMMIYIIFYSSKLIKHN